MDDPFDEGVDYTSIAKKLKKPKRDDESDEEDRDDREYTWKVLK